MLFSKHVAGPEPKTLATALLANGITSLDLAVRPGGHVEPRDVESALPELVGELRNAGIDVGMLTTNVVDARDPLTRAVLETASELGIKHYKLGYWRYDGFGNLRRQRDEVTEKVKEIATLNLELGLIGGFHNHSHDFIGASLADVAAILDEVPKEAMVAYLDPAHAVIEGGGSGWYMGLDLLRYRIGMLAVKDFRWVEGKQRYGGGRRQSVEFCPLEDGNTPWPEVIRLLKQVDFAGPISFHSEYQGPHSFEDLTWSDVIAQTARDVKLFRIWLAGADDSPHDDRLR